MSSFLDRLAASRAMSAKTFQIAAASCGIISSVLFFLSFVISGNVAPMKPWWTAEQTVQHWKDHLKGAHVAAAFLQLSGSFYIPFSAVISIQIRRIPGIHPTVYTVQTAAAAAGIFTFMLPGMILGTVTYRLDRDPEITQALSDLFWIVALMPWPTFMIQDFAFAYATLKDTSPKKLFPRYVTIVNILVPLLFVPGTALHTTTRGPVAFNGAFAFWVPGVTFCLQLIFDSVCLIRAIKMQYEVVNEIEVRNEIKVQDEEVSV